MIYDLVGLPMFQSHSSQSVFTCTALQNVRMFSRPCCVPDSRWKR